ncbi:hypothetical protein CRUP_021746, partial [Coryphaenoides rupestris]
SDGEAPLGPRSSSSSSSSSAPWSSSRPTSSPPPPPPAGRVVGLGVRVGVVVVAPWRSSPPPPSPTPPPTPQPLPTCTTPRWTAPTPPAGTGATRATATTAAGGGGGGDPRAPGGSLPMVEAVVIPIIYAAVCAVGLAGNTLVIYVILRYARSGANITNTYILNLAVADELFMLGLPFLAAQNALLAWPFGTPLCRVVMTVDALNQFTGIFCLTALSVDRYLAVVHPVRAAGWRRPRVARAVNGAVWAASAVVVLPVVAFADVLEDAGNCSIAWPEPAEVWKATFIVYTSAVGFLCPLLVICMCYLLIVVKVRSAGKLVRATSSRRRKSERKITRMVVVVVAVFVLCWLPFYALNVVNLLVVLPDHFRGLYFFVVVLSYANSCANPILYAFLSDNFKRGFHRALCRSSRRVESHERVRVVVAAAAAAGSAAGAAVGSAAGAGAGEAVELQRPTEEWGGGVAMKPQNRRNLGAEEEEEDDEEETRENDGGGGGGGGVQGEWGAQGRGERQGG